MISWESFPLEEGARGARETLLERGEEVLVVMVLGLFELIGDGFWVEWERNDMALAS